MGVQGGWGCGFGGGTVPSEVLQHEEEGAGVGLGQ